MIRTFTFYNHKGGVSKTTTTFNLAAYLASRKKKKVLLVDADPQSNLTENFFVPPMDDDADALPGTSIYEALRPRFEGAAARIDAAKINLPQHKKYKKLYILRGDWNFSLAERYFSNALALAITESVHEKHTYVAFYNLIQDLIALHKFDHVLIDLGPASGAITNLALLSCDGYFIPVTPDRFCTQAVEALARLIKTWLERHERTIATFRPFGVTSFPGKPVFLGAVSNNFKAYAGRTKKPYEYWEKQILKIVESDLVPAVPTAGDVSSYVASIKDFGGLAPVAHIVGKAIFDLNKEGTKQTSASGDTWSGVALDSWLGKASRTERTSRINLLPIALFSPKAYLLESQVAQAPRIMVDSNILEMLPELESLVLRSGDNRYLNVVTRDSFQTVWSYAYAAFEASRPVIRRDERVRAKHRWLQEFLREMAESLGLPVSTRYLGLFDTEKMAV